ncbi:MAG: hypothetical protein CR986_10175 [Ignavibacteriae bacterium]|nr:MAG: hypothetical protein CR986_10175 [Ignavibacteriota bacterium]
MENINKVLKREVSRIKNNKPIFLLLFVMPFALIIVFSLFFSKSKVTEIPIAVVDKDGSQISTLLQNYLNSSESLDITETAGSIEEVEELILQNKVDGALIIGNSFYKDLKKGKQANLTFIINAANLIKSNLMYKNVLQVVKTVSGGVLLKKLRSKGLTENAAMGIIKPINIDTQILYNSNLSYSTYLVPALTMVMLQIVVMLVGVLVLSKEYAENTINNLFQVANKKLTAIIIGKSLPYLAIILFIVISYIFIFFPLFNLPSAGNTFGFFILTYAFMVISFFAALGAGAVLKDPVFSTELTIFFTTPAFIFSGVTFPIIAMPLFHKIYAHLIPFTFYVKGFMKVYLMGVPTIKIIGELFIITIFGIVGLAAASFVIYRSIRTFKPEIGN